MVNEGQSYVELEAVKMIVLVKATAAGKTTHTRGAGNIVGASELLEALELTDLTQVKKIVPFESAYVHPTKHFGDGFRPTSDKTEWTDFQSSAPRPGYFGVGANGDIHEYADSQFGHIFAHGKTRVEAWIAPMLSLRNMDVVRTIRNPVE